MKNKVLKDDIFNPQNLEIGSQLFEKAPIYFHWSNSAAGTKFVQNMARENEMLDQSLRAIWHRLSELKNVQLWLKTREHIIPMNLFDVYLTLVGHLKKQDQEDNLFNCHEVSFIGPEGPYRETTLVQLLNRHTYYEFIYYYLIKNKLPLRDYRLFVSGAVVLQFGPNLCYSTVVNVRQLTSSGVLFSSKDEQLLEKVSSGPLLKFMAMSDHLSQIKNGCSTFTANKADLFFTTDVCNFFSIVESRVMKSLSFESGISGEYFLYCRYHDMTDGEFPDVAKDFVEYSKALVFKDVA